MGELVEIDARRRGRRPSEVASSIQDAALVTTRRIVVDHVLFVVGDLVASRRLYTAALAPIGYEELHVQDDGVHYWVRGTR